MEKMPKNKYVAKVAKLIHASDKDTKWLKTQDELFIENNGEEISIVNSDNRRMEKRADGVYVDVSQFIFADLPTDIVETYYKTAHKFLSDKLIDNPEMLKSLMERDLELKSDFKSEKVVSGSVAYVYNLFDSKVIDEFKLKSVATSPTTKYEYEHTLYFKSWDGFTYKIAQFAYESVLNSDKDENLERKIDNYNKYTNNFIKSLLVEKYLLENNGKFTLNILAKMKFSEIAEKSKLWRNVIENQLDAGEKIEILLNDLIGQRELDKIAKVPTVEKIIGARMVQKSEIDELNEFLKTDDQNHDGPELILGRR